MNPLSMVIVYMLGGVGVGLAIVRTVQVFRWQINIPAFNAALIKLARAGNMERALKLCRVAPNAIYARMVTPAIQAAMDQETDGLRRAAAMERAFAEAEPAAMKLDHNGPLLSGIALAACVAAAAVALVSGVAPVQYVLAGAAAPAAVSLFSLNASRRLRRNARPRFQELVAAVRKSTED